MAEIDVASTGPRIHGFIADLVGHRRRFTVRLARTLGMSAAFYLLAVLAIGAIHLLSRSQPRHGLHIATIPLTIAAEPAAVMVTGLITASIAFNIRFVSSDHEREFSEARENGDTSALASLATRTSYGVAVLDVVAILAGVLALSTFFHGASHLEVDAIGSAIVSVLALVATVLAVDTSTVARVRMLQAITEMSRQVAETTRLHTSWQRWSTAVSVGGVADVESGPSAQGSSTRLYARCALVATTTSVAALALALPIGSKFDIRWTLHLAGQLFLIIAFMSGINFFLLVSLSRLACDTFARNVSNAVLAGVMTLVILLFQAMLVIESFFTRAPFVVKCATALFWFADMLFLLAFVVMSVRRALRPRLVGGNRSHRRSTFGSLIASAILDELALKYRLATANLDGFAALNRRRQPRSLRRLLAWYRRMSGLHP